MQSFHALSRAGYGAGGEILEPMPALPQDRQSGDDIPRHESEISPAQSLPTIHDRREVIAERVIGRLVAVNGSQGVLDCELDSEGEGWSVGHLITIVHGATRVIGVVCDIATGDGRWNAGAPNYARVTIELSGEIIDAAPGVPVFQRGIRSFPSLGAGAHRIRAADLRAIYSFRGGQGVEIGHLTQIESIPATVNVNELISRHFAVMGSTGVGKTTAVAILLRKAVAQKPKLRILILDPHNEYSARFLDIANVIDSDSLELPFWMFRFDEFAEVVFGGRKPHPDERDALLEIIRAAKAKYVADNAGQTTTSALRRPVAGDSAAHTADSPTPYRIAHAVAVIDEWLGKLDQRFPRSDLRVLKYRLEGLSRDPRYRFMFGKLLAEDDIGRVIAKIFRIPMQGAPITILQMAGLPNEVVNAVVSVLARLAFEVAFWSAGAFEMNVLCEEAHRYIPSDQAQGFGPARQAIGRIAKEGRKYGVSLGVVTQRPSELDPTVLSQCTTMFAMRLANEADKNIIRAAVGASAMSTISFLSSVADREAIAFGEAIATPMRMKFGDYSPGTGRRDPSSTSSGDTPPIDLRRLVARMRGETS